MTEKVTLHLVWNKAMNECVGFSDPEDARYTSTGRHNGMWSSIGEAFRECYAGDDGDDILPITLAEVEV